MAFPISDLRLAQLCGLAYTLPPTFETSDAHVAITIESGFVIVAFRGSKSLIDWIRDFMIAPAVAPKDSAIGVCHSGFLFDVLALDPQLVAYIQRYPCIICGHSKGGAEAQLFAALLVLHGVTPARLVTFGAPRCVWISNTTVPKLIGAIPGSDYRDMGDPVTQVPLPYIHGRPAAFVQLGEPKFELNPIPRHFLPNYEALLAA